MNLKTRFRTLLSPYLEMLRYKQRELSNQDWLNQVERTKASVLSNLDQYLGQDLPNHQIINEEVSALFNEFLIESLQRTETIKTD